MSRAIALLGWLGFLVSFSLLAHAADDREVFAAQAKPFLKKFCVSCHGADVQEAGLDFHTLDRVTAENSETWRRIWEQVALKEMPPKDERDQPAPLDRLQLTTSITRELVQALKSKGGFNTHLRPAKGNHLDHDLLFGKLPPGLVPASTPARIWRLHPQEHLTRLNELINREPDFDPKNPGLRTRGDHIAPNQEGDVKVYYGLDNLIGWVGGTAAYAAAITGFPPILTTDDHRGLRNYSHLYSVNGSEATQIASTAEEIIRFMAYGPKAEPYQFADKVSDIDEKYKHESLRGLTQSLFYSKTPKRPLTPVYDLMKDSGVSEDRMKAAVNYLFEALTLRPPTEKETAAYLGLLKQAINDLGKEQGAILGLTPIFLDRDALFRPELVAEGTPDRFGRVMLQDYELALAVNAAFCYIAPDKTLTQAVSQGKMKTREDVVREVTRILSDDTIRKPRMLQFFREYFDYDRAEAVCKDAKALAAAGGESNMAAYHRSVVNMTAGMDRLIEIILEEDKNVLEQLLTTDRVVLDVGQDARYFAEYVGADRSRPKEDVEKTDGKKKGKSIPPTVSLLPLPKGEVERVRIALVVKPGRTERTLTKLPAEQRLGILTHPNWLVAHSDAMDNHAILRGKWIRERLLGGAVADVPITVNAMLPDEPTQTLRERMRVTRDEYCWKCHQKMDPLGLPFEMYNHIGLFRTKELNKPVDTSGEIINSGDPALDGPVANALEMIQKLAKSERVKQVFVRHAFRYWMGRNETINDAPILQEAYQAYTKSGGSMKALVATLVTSDAFLYRTRSEVAAAK